MCLRGNAHTVMDAFWTVLREQLYANANQYKVVSIKSIHWGKGTAIHHVVDEVAEVIYETHPHFH